MMQLFLGCTEHERYAGGVNRFALPALDVPCSNPLDQDNLKEKQK